MAPKASPKGAKRDAKDVLEKEGAPKIAKEQPEQTPGAATEAEEPKIAEAANGTKATESEPVKTTEDSAEPAKDITENGEPAKAVQGDPLGDAAAATKEADAVVNGAEEGVKAGTTEKVEPPKEDEKDKAETVTEPKIGEGEPVQENE